MRFIIVIGMLLAAGAVQAAPALVDVATISMSAPGVPRTVTDTLCASDGTDLVCDRGAQLLPGGVISTTTISTTAVQIFSPTTALACSSNTAGTIRYNSPTTSLELCTGTGWQPMGVGIPAGTISAFASTTCPTGWSEYTAARGRFLRGIDNSAGNDPDGTRAPGATQADLLKSHSHSFSSWYGGIGGDGGGGLDYGSAVNYGPSNVTASAGGAETRPKNVAVTFCQFNGTSNGWNNPLSGGGTSAAGSTGQVQYNTSGAFDASPDFTWTNGSKVLGVAGAVSTASVQLSTAGGACGTVADAGRIFRNPTSGRLQMCMSR